MPQRFTLRSLLTLPITVIAMLGGTVTASAEPPDSSVESLVCEYEVTGSGTPAWERWNFGGPREAISYYWPNAVVWAAPGQTWNHNAREWVKQLNERNRYWVLADKLRRTSTKCQPL